MYQNIKKQKRSQNTEVLFQTKNQDHEIVATMTNV